MSTDYLLKDEIEAVEYAAGQTDYTEPPMRRVSMETANEFLALKELTAKRIAFAVFLCILAPICLLLLSAWADTGRISLSESVAAGIVIVVLLMLVTPAVAIFISCGMKTHDYEYLEQEVFDLEYVVDGMVREKLKRYKA